MRDPGRLNAFYSELKAIHQTQCPDWRFTQMIVNIMRANGSDMFYCEEEKFLEKAREYFHLQA